MRPAGYQCGNVMAVNPGAIKHISYEQMFFINATIST